MPLNSYKPNHLFLYLYELALLLTVLILVFLPWHKSLEKHYNIDRIIDNSTVAFKVDNPIQLALGASFPIYRLNSGETASIGQIHIDELRENEVIATYSPDEFKWPMGRHGRVLGNKDKLMQVSMGYQLGFRVGDVLCLFKDRELIGKIRLNQVNEQDSMAEVLYMNKGAPYDQLTVSEYIIATQVVILDNPWFLYFELFVIIASLLIFTYLSLFQHYSFLQIIGPKIDVLKKQMNNKEATVFLQIVMGVPFIWFIVNFFPRCLFYLSQVTVNLCNTVFSLNLRLPDLITPFYAQINYAYFITGVVYLIVLLIIGRNPILMFWRLFAFKSSPKSASRSFWGHLLVWTLHLIIFYAFGNTLWGFLNGNLNACMQLLWPQTKVFWYEINYYALLGAPKALSEKEFFQLIRFLLWSITIVGCMFGYGYSVFGYLWGKKIRNLDFTFMGWVTNAICYGPLLGGVMYQMTPYLTGSEPIVTQGPLLSLTMLAETFLNLAYTISIWNLGSMFGVMTDKGVKTTGFYSVVRHPSYTLEALMFLMIYINGFSSYLQWITILNITFFAYFVRSEREDQFMSASNPEYTVYKNKTPYKFIPGVY